ncbi:hypothetical protein RT717_03715 [Imperialibacter roseus]|uniref:GCN5 family acetyltransferase n=1 Tax=Imperialibacter roseus TaxID=1324217 RepID=A0ABZ0ITL4_9BACT|nr:hypothetical protein [Imperialibacter roseus]WOK07730.1 hypothetical protein RT717_03715 [Imperialibacter roseus]
MSKYPDVKDPNLVGTYPPVVKAGGGFVWDDVLEYRVWCHPHDGAPDLYDGDDYYYAFGSFEEAFEFSQNNAGCEEPLALILQTEHINEPEPGLYVLVQTERLTEWPAHFLSRPRRTKELIDRFFSADPGPNKLDILRGLVE